MRWPTLGLLAGIGGLTGYLLLGGPRLSADVKAVIDRVVRSGDVSGVVTGDTGFATSGQVRIWYESIPPPGQERGVVLLSSAMAGDALFWPPPFIRALSGAGYRVIRYDHRGTGASDWMADWDRAAPYSLLDMAGDAVAVLDASSVDRAHLVGLSLGGFVAQEVAIAHPDRVASLTLLSTAADPTDATLPGPRTSFLLSSGLRGLPLLRYWVLGGEVNRIRGLVAKTMIAGVAASDLGEVGELARTALYVLRRRRGINLKALRQHQTAVAVTRSRYDLLPQVTSPTLVVHGTDDPVLPLAHAEKLAQLLPHARHLWLDGVGHQFPYPDPVTVHAITAHMDLIDTDGSGGPG
ncbi:alpha/beta fold hydrolase [Aquipuribacter sp. MA13-6]|uniref:alpha/beta fold hydrolase n=1 Tax=unclassified Aquipuribacter TaxID=2635084 RepID=UPI003EEA177B